METAEQNLSSEIMPDSKRPQLLKVICILSFIWIGIGGVMTIWGLVFKPSQEEIDAKVEQIRAYSEESAVDYQEAMEMQQTTGYAINQAVSVVALALSLLGVMMMWQMKRNGFWLYCIGEIIPYSGFIFVGTKSFGSLGKLLHTDGSTAAAIMIGAMIAFDLLFIALYYTSLKHMKK